MLRVRETETILPTLRVLPHGISRKRLEQAVKELQLPVIVARDPDEADVVMTLKSEYRQKTAGAARGRGSRSADLRPQEQHDRPDGGQPDLDLLAGGGPARGGPARDGGGDRPGHPQRAEPVELSPQNAYIRRLQHQMAERANLVSRSRGREPYRRVRLYP